MAPMHKSKITSQRTVKTRESKLDWGNRINYGDEHN